VATAVVTVDGAGSVVETSIATRGVADDADDIESAKGAVRAAIAELARGPPATAAVAEHARLAIRRTFNRFAWYEAG